MDDDSGDSEEDEGEEDVSVENNPRNKRFNR